LTSDNLRARKKGTLLFRALLCFGWFVLRYFLVYLLFYFIRFIFWFSRVRFSLMLRSCCFFVLTMSDWLSGLLVELLDAGAVERVGWALDQGSQGGQETRTLAHLFGHSRCGQVPLMPGSDFFLFLSLFLSFLLSLFISFFIYLIYYLLICWFIQSVVCFAAMFCPMLTPSRAVGSRLSPHVSKLLPLIFKFADNEDEEVSDEEVKDNWYCILFALHPIRHSLPFCLLFVLFCWFRLLSFLFWFCREVYFTCCLVMPLSQE
jgi:hypothetical protein